MTTSTAAHQIKSVRFNVEAILAAAAEAGITRAELESRIGRPLEATVGQIAEQAKSEGVPASWLLSHADPTVLDLSRILVELPQLSFADACIVVRA